MLNEQGIFNPFEHEKERVRLNLEVPLEVRAFLRAVYPEHGGIQAVINMIIDDLHQELKNQGITHYDDSHKQSIYNAVHRRTPFRTAKKATP